MSVLSAIRGFLPRRDAGISVPAMDGVFKPNNHLESAAIVGCQPELDDIAPFGGGLVVSSGSTLYLFTPQKNAKPNSEGKPDSEGKSDLKKLDAFGAEISFVAPLSNGALAVGLVGQGVQIGMPGNWRSISIEAKLANCMTAATALPDGRLVVAVGSLDNAVLDWKRDLMERRKTGLVVIIDLESGDTRVIAENLAYPHGLAVLENGSIAVSESWRHRIIAISATGAGVTGTLLDDLPAYPARISTARDGGYWLALFAPRRQMFEMVLREDDFRTEMMASIAPSDWVGPSLSPSDRPDYPLQQGAVRQMGILKPWAPSSSYGLVAKCDAAMRPLESWHSRADGTRHGIMSVCETDGGVFAASKGAGVLLHLAQSGIATKETL